MTEITVGNYHSRHEPGHVERFRNAVRVRMASEPARREAEVREKAIDLIAAALTEAADLSGFELVDFDQHSAAAPRWSEQRFDYGHALGMGGEVVARFTATHAQMNRWLIRELEKREQHIRALERWWAFRLAGFLDYWAHRLLGYALRPFRPAWHREEEEETP